MARPVRLPDPVYERASDIKEEEDFASLGEVVRQAFIKAGYDV